MSVAVSSLHSLPSTPDIRPLTFLEQNLTDRSVDKTGVLANKLCSGPLHVFGQTPSGGGGQCLSVGGPSLTAGLAAGSAAVSAPCASTGGAICGRPQLILLHSYLRYGRRCHLKEGRREGGGRECRLSQNFNFEEI